MNDHNSKTQQNLQGVVERIVFHSTESGFCVLRVSASSHPDLVTVVGHAPIIHTNEHIEAEGEWHHDRSYGIQFKASCLKIVPPNTLDGIEKYLGSGLIKGIGPHFAKKLIAAFGADLLSIIESYPERLRALAGIGQKRCDDIIQSLAEQKSVRDILVFLQSYGIGSVRAIRIYKTYGDKALEKIRENPYILAQDIHGIGFRIADELAQKLGIPQDSLMRARAGIQHVLQEFCQHGHCGMPLSELIQSSLTLLNMREQTIEMGITEEIHTKKILFENSHIFPSLFYHAEESIVKHIKRLLYGKTPWEKINLQETIPWVEKQTGLILSDSQKQAVEKALASKIMILTGGPGVGKTTIVKSILHIITAKNLKITLCAPTGRAAKRLSESTGHAAKTIHRLLELQPGKERTAYHQQHPLDTDFVVVDEASMIDVTLMNALLKAIPSHAGVLIVGDKDQLPSIGSGAVLSDLIHSQFIPTASLTEIFRQSKTSDIVINAHRINAGKMLDLKNNQHTDFYFIEAGTPEKTREILLKVVTDNIPKAFHFNPLEDIQILTPMQKGMLGVRSLNNDLQNSLNPAIQKISHFGMRFSTGDKVMQTVNNYDKDIFNGDVGIIQAIDTDKEILKINFDGRIIEYYFNTLEEIRLAYAMTIHKSQGSEYPAVVIPLVTQHAMMLERNLLYTAVTRGKKLVVIIGSQKALEMAIHNMKNRERLTRLRDKLQPSA